MTANLVSNVDMHLLLVWLEVLLAMLTLWCQEETWLEDYCSTS